MVADSRGRPFGNDVRAKRQYRFDCACYADAEQYEFCYSNRCTRNRAFSGCNVGTHSNAGSACHANAVAHVHTNANSNTAAYVHTDANSGSYAHPGSVSRTAAHR